jgi:hypothetical protein
MKVTWHFMKPGHMSLYESQMSLYESEMSLYETGTNVTL